MAAWRIVGLAVLLTTTAVAEEAPLPSATLTYVVGPNDDSCPSESSLRDEIRRRLGYDPFRDKARTEVGIVVAKSPAGYVARITTSQDDAAPALREIRGVACAELAQSVVSAVSLAIDPRSFAGPRVIRPREPEPRPEPEDHEQQPPPRPEKKIAPSPRWFVDINAAMRVGVGVVPSVSLGPLLDLRVGRRWVALLVDAGVDFPTGSATTAALTPARVHASLLWAGVGACFTPHRFFSFFVCGRIDAGALEGTGEGIADVHTATSPYADFAALAGATYNITHGFQVGVRAELLVPFTRTTLNLDDTPVWSTPAVAGAFGVSLGYRR